MFLLLLQSWFRCEYAVFLKRCYTLYNEQTLKIITQYIFSKLSYYNMWCESVKYGSDTEMMVDSVHHFSIFTITYHDGSQRELPLQHDGICIREIGTQSPTYRRPNQAKIFFVQFSFYFSFADLEHEIWATITVSWILLLGLIVYPFPGAVSLSPALKSAAKQLLELILCLTFRWYWTGVLNWKYNRHCSLFPKKLPSKRFFSVLASKGL